MPGWLRLRFQFQYEGFIRAIAPHTLNPDRTRPGCLKSPAVPSVCMFVFVYRVCCMRTVQ